MKESKYEMPKPEEISAILAAVSKEIPELVKGILETFFSPQAAANVGEAVATFHKKLKDGGIPEEQALQMTRDYLGTLTKWSEAMREMKWEQKFGRHED